MWPRNQPRSCADLVPAEGAAGTPRDVPAWRRPLRALVGHDDPAKLTTIPAAASWHTLVLGQRFITAAILANLGLEVDAAGRLVEQQRERLRVGGMRRSDDIETLTALVHMLVGSPIITSDQVEGIHRAYQHLRQCHWWPSGPEDLPLAALLVSSTTDADQQIARIEALHVALSDGDEVPGDVCALVALCGSVSGMVDAQVLIRISALRTELLLSGIAVQDDDIAALLALASIHGDPVAVMQEFILERKNAAPNAGSLALAIASATDVVVLRRLVGVARQGYIATLAIRSWLIDRPHQPPSSTWIPRR